MASRWIGYDMDECIGNVVCLHYFIVNMNNTDRNNFKKIIWESEKSGETWLFRPSFLKTFPIVKKFVDDGKINGAFIYSNNSSQILVDFIVDMLNMYMENELGAKETIFRMGSSSKCPCRVKEPLIKSFDNIQNTLKCHKLPLLSSPNDLLFFDDQIHILIDEIPNYAQVKPYTNLTPIYSLMLLTLKNENELPSLERTKASSMAMNEQMSHIDNKQTLLRPMANYQIENEIQQFKHFYINFISGGYNKRYGRHSTRKTHSL